MPRSEGLKPIGDSVKKLIEKLKREREERRNRNKPVRTQPKLPGMKKGGDVEGYAQGGISRKKGGRRKPSPFLGLPGKPLPRPRPGPGPGRPPQQRKKDPSPKKQDPNFGVEFNKDGPSRPGKDVVGYMVKKGGLIGGQKKLDANKDGKISGDDFKILKGKNNKMKGGGIAIRGTNFKGIY